MRADAAPEPPDGVRLVPVPVDRAAATLAGDFRGLVAGDGPALRSGRGWPHDDTGHALAFLAVGGLTWLVVDDSGAVVGELGTKGPPSPDGRVEIGYGLAPASRGRGLGTAAVRALVDTLRGRPDVTTLEADVELGNLASRRLLERLGFDSTGSDGAEVRYRLEPGSGPSPGQHVG